MRLPNPGGGGESSKLNIVHWQFNTLVSIVVLAPSSNASQLRAEYEGGAKALEAEPNKDSLEILGVKKTISLNEPTEACHSSHLRA
jgi:hypothetical protein